MKLTLQQLEAHLWGAANILRGKTAGQDYKNYILSLMFFKRLCDQWEGEADDAIVELERQQERGFQAIYQTHADRLVAVDAEISAARTKRDTARTKGDKAAAETALAKLEKPRERLVAKVAERDEQIAEARRRAEDDRQEVANVGSELLTLYVDSDELLKHARVVGLDEIEENEFNLNIPRYVDTFEPEPHVNVKDALMALAAAAQAAGKAEEALSRMLVDAGYAD